MTCTEVLEGSGGEEQPRKQSCSRDILRRLIWLLSAWLSSGEEAIWMELVESPKQVSRALRIVLRWLNNEGVQQLAEWADSRQRWYSWSIYVVNVLHCVGSVVHGGRVQEGSEQNAILALGDTCIPAGISSGNNREPVGD